MAGRGKEAQFRNRINIFENLDMNSVAAVTPVVMTLFGNSEIRRPLNNPGKIYVEQIFAYVADPKINIIYNLRRFTQ